MWTAPRRLRASMGACRSWANADDRLPVNPLGGVEGGDGVVEGRDVADVRPQPSVPHPPGDLTQLGAIRHDDAVDPEDADGARPEIGRARCGERGGQSG